MSTWRVRLEYDGTDFAGWQLQPGQRTVQGEVEAALSKLLGQSGRVPVVASGRTDTGVHALGQVVHFRTQVVRSAEQVRNGLNALFPLDVSCVGAQVAPDDFHARFWAKQKTYRYVLRVGPRSALRRDREWVHRRPLSVEVMRQGLEPLLGTHDFTSFRAAGCTAQSPVRRLVSAQVRLVGDQIWVELSGEGFLRHMVRNIVGSLVDVGRGKHPPEWMGELLAAKDRGQGGRTAPGCGLYLVRVDYGD